MSRTSHRIADPLRRPRALGTASRFAIAGLVLVGIADAVWLGATVNLYRGTGVSEIARLPGLHTAYARQESINLLSNLLAAALFIPWFAMAYGNLRRLGVEHVPWSDRWAVGAWFVPFVSIWRPKQIANEIWRGSESGADVSSERWRLGEVSHLVHWWWGLYLVGGFVAAIGAGIISAGYKQLLRDAALNLAVGGDVSEIRTGAVIVIIGAALLLGAAACAVIFVRQASERFEGIRRRLIEEEPLGGYPPISPPQPVAAATQPGSHPPPSPSAHPAAAAAVPARMATYPGSPPAPVQGLVSCPECAELVPPQGDCRYCGYALGGSAPPSKR